MSVAVWTCVTFALPVAQVAETLPLQDMKQEIQQILEEIDFYKFLWIGIA